jgi:hypothetical protein
MAHHLAQLNVGLLAAPLDSAQLHDFVANLAEINGIADRSPGFVWRLADDSGDGATSLRPFGPDVLVNMSVWESLESLRAFVFRSPHLTQLRRRREFFRPYPGQYQVLWWVPAGHIPEPAEAGERLALLSAHGPTPAAFTFRNPFPEPGTLAA